MSLKEIAEIGMYVAGAGVLYWSANELRKRYTNWAEKNNFYDKSPKFNDLENKIYKVGDVAGSNGDEIRKISSLKR